MIRTNMGSEILFQIRKKINSFYLYYCLLEMSKKF